MKEIKNVVMNMAHDKKANIVLDVACLVVGVINATYGAYRLTIDIKK